MSPTNIELVAIGLAVAVTYGSLTNHLASRIAHMFRRDDDAEPGPASTR